MTGMTSGNAIILASHGELAREALRTVEMVIGRQENVSVLSVTDDKNLEACLPEMLGMCDELDTTTGLFILADMYGGTPCNVSSSILLQKQHEMNIELLSGFSLPMLLETFLNRNMQTADLKEHITRMYPEMFKDLKIILNESGEDDADQLG